MICIGYDFFEIAEKHPEYTEILAKVCNNRPTDMGLACGIEMAATILERHPDIQNLLTPGETNEDADQRRLSRYLNEIIVPRSYRFGGTEELETLIRELAPTHFDRRRGALGPYKNGRVRISGSHMQEMPELAVDLSANEYFVLEPERGLLSYDRQQATPKVSG